MNDHTDDDDIIYCTKEHQEGEWEVTSRMLLARESPELICFIFYKNVLCDITKEYTTGQNPAALFEGSKFTSLLSPYLCPLPSRGAILRHNSNSSFRHQPI